MHAEHIQKPHSAHTRTGQETTHTQQGHWQGKRAPYEGPQTHTAHHKSQRRTPHTANTDGTEPPNTNKNTHHHQQQSRAKSGGDLHPEPSARIGRGPPAVTSGKLQAAMAGSRNQGHQQGLARGHTSKMQQIPSRNGGAFHPGHSARKCKDPPAKPNSRPQPGLAGHCTQGAQPGLARAQLLHAHKTAHAAGTHPPHQHSDTH